MNSIKNPLIIFGALTLLATIVAIVYQGLYPFQFSFGAPREVLIFVLLLLKGFDPTELYSLIGLSGSFVVLLVILWFFFSKYSWPWWARAPFALWGTILLFVFALLGFMSLVIFA